MNIILGILACVLLGTLCIIIFKVRQIVRELEKALHLRRRLLSDRPSSLLHRLGFGTLLAEANELVDKFNDYADIQSDRLNQLEDTLGSIQESVIIFSEQRVIEYANQSAQRLLRQGAALKGIRLESVLRSSSLIDFLDAYQAKGSDVGQQQISLQPQPNTTLWFEASCSEVRGVSVLSEVSTLLVLHDITRLKGLEEIRRKFIANISHELRTPLTIIKGYVEALLEDNTKLSDETRERFLDKIARNTQRLSALVEDVLTLSSLESKPDRINLAVNSLHEILDDTVEDYRSRIVAGKQQIVLEFDHKVKKCAFDRLRIQQVFENLIENAFKYAMGFSLIKVSVVYESASNTVQCSVSDDGPGIPEKDLPHIFERFYRVDKGRSYDGGSGLGLSIVKHIVQQHGGTVSAESTFGKGTVVHFDFPYIKSLRAVNALPDPAKKTDGPTLLQES